MLQVALILNYIYQGCLLRNNFLFSQKKKSALIGLRVYYTGTNFIDNESIIHGSSKLTDNINLLKLSQPYGVSVLKIKNNVNKRANK